MEISNIIFNRIIMMNLILWIVGIFLFLFTKKWYYLFLVVYVFIFNEIIHILFNLDLYFSHDRTELMYSSGSLNEIIGTELQQVKSNLTEGYFPNKTKISTEESEMNRFDEFIRLLDIQSGDYVLDAGCGLGGLVAYLRSKGFNAYGITITKHQYVENNKKHGEYFYYGDYTKFNPELINRFDHIILPGSLEHPFGGNHCFESSYEYKFDGMRNMFTFMKKYFRKDSTKKKMLCTCLHLNMKYKFSYEMFIMERAAGCLYPPTDHLSVADSLKEAGYNVLRNDDYTWHYYFTTVCDKNHFGYPTDIGTFFTFFGSFFYPILLYVNYAGNSGLWMWMFDGKMHYRKNPEFSFIEDINERPCTLFYTVSQCLDKRSENDEIIENNIQPVKNDNIIPWTSINTKMSFSNGT
jgi:cyclopropane fatty-acyl-phospholipid synthase-like methyltransferase